MKGKREGLKGGREGGWGGRMEGKRVGVRVGGWEGGKEGEEGRGRRYQNKIMSRKKGGHTYKKENRYISSLMYINIKLYYFYLSFPIIIIAKYSNLFITTECSLSLSLL